MKVDLQEVSEPGSQQCVLCREPADDAPSTSCERCSTLAHQACAWELSREACPTPGCGAWQVERPSEAALLRRRKRSGPLFERRPIASAPAYTGPRRRSKRDSTLAETLTRWLATGLFAVVVVLATARQWVLAGVFAALLVGLFLWIGAALRKRSRARHERYRQLVERDAARRNDAKKP